MAMLSEAEEDTEIGLKKDPRATAKPAAAAPKIPAVETTGGMVVCPKCGLEQQPGAACILCDAPLR